LTLLNHRIALIVDEISMLDGRYFDKMDAIARAVKRSSEPFGGSAGFSPVTGT